MGKASRPLGRMGKGGLGGPDFLVLVRPGTMKLTPSFSLDLKQRSIDLPARNT